MISKLEELMSKLCFKCVDPGIYPPLERISREELEVLEKALADRLKPIEPHLKKEDRRIIIDDLLNMADREGC